MSDRMLQAALAYVQQLGWPVFPCHWITEAGACSCGLPHCGSPGKHPLTGQGFKEANRDEAQIRGWWTRWPAANIAIPTGAVSGFDVLDVDPRHGGEESLAELELIHGRLPVTVEQITGGGQHLLFKHREGVASRTGVLPGIDVRGEGGYILTAPSNHHSGRQYAWELSSRPGEVDLAEWPAWLLEMVQQPTNGKPKEPAPAIEGPIPEGGRNATLTSLAGTMRRRGMGELEILAALRAVNETRCKPPLTDTELQGITGSVVRYAPQHRETATNADTRPAEAQERPRVRRLAEVESEDVRWLWWPRIPLRHLTTLEGDPGEGKSFVAQAIATAISRGQGLPNTNPTTPASVLLLAAEDHAGCTIRPRLEALGADLERVFCCTDGFTLDAAGLEILEGLLKETLPRLVVLDPLTAYLPSNLDLHRANEVRAPLKALAALSERYDCAVLIVRHLAKGSTSKAIYRGLGTIDITAAARSALLAGHDPDNRDSRAIVQIKSNLGPLADPVGYNIELGRFVWTGSTGLTAGQILAPEVEDGAMSEARRFLRELLSEGAKAAGEVEEEARAAGISSATLRRAKKALGVKVAKQGFQGAYQWSLPIEEGVL